MKILSKWKCNAIRLYSNDPNGAKTYFFSPVTGGSDENRSFSKYTPSGELSMYVDNPECVFEIGKEYYLTFEAAQS